MAWCVYCNRHTLNGRCPVCNRLYEQSKQFFSGKSTPTEKNHNKIETVSYQEEKRKRSFSSDFFFLLLSISRNHYCGVDSQKKNAQRRNCGNNYRNNHSSDNCHYYY